jgi:protein phosphatase
MTIGRRQKLKAGDVLLACTDGMWASLQDQEISQLWKAPAKLREVLQELGQRAVQSSAPHSDNASAAAVRWLG